MFAWPRTSVFSMLCERNNFGFGLNFTQVCKETSDLQGRSQRKNIPIFFVLYNKIRRVQYPCLHCFSYFVSYYTYETKKSHKKPIYVKITTKKSRKQHGDESKNIFDWYYYEIFSVFYLKVCSMYQLVERHDKHSILVQFCPKNEHYPFKELLKVSLLSTIPRSLEKQRCIIRMCL